MQRGEGSRTLLIIIAIFCAVSIVQGLADNVYVRLSGRIGQDVLLDLRVRLFDHFQRLSLGFHERYTSGRVISRLTSDVDALEELLMYGLQTLVSELAHHRQHHRPDADRSTGTWRWSRCRRSRSCW